MLQRGNKYNFKLAFAIAMIETISAGAGLGRSPPFSRAGTGRMLMSPHDRQPFQIGLPRQSRQDAIENAHFDPAIIASLHALIVFVSFGKIASASSEPGHAQESVDEKPIVGSRTAPSFGATGHQEFQVLPPVITQPVARHR